MLLSINGQAMHPPADKFSWRGMTHRKEKSAYREKKNCLPYREKSAYHGEKILLTRRRKNSLPPAVKSAYRAQLNHLDSRI